MGIARNTLETKENLTEGSEQERLLERAGQEETNNDDNLMQVQSFTIHEFGAANPCLLFLFSDEFQINCS
jgi:hypothetical protein